MAVYEASRQGPEVVHRSTGYGKWLMRLWKRPFWFSKKVHVTLSLNWSRPYQGGCSQFLISSRCFDSSICDWQKIILFLCEISPLSHFVFSSRFPTRPSSPTPRLWSVRHPSKFPPRTKRIRTIQIKLSKLMDSWLILRICRMILNQWTKWNNKSCKWLPKHLS